MKAADTGMNPIPYSVADRFSTTSNTLGTVTVTVGGVNDAPAVANIGGITTDEANAVAGGFVGQDVDDDESVASLFGGVDRSTCSSTTQAS